MMTDEQILALPKKTANRAEVDAYYYADAFLDKISDIEKAMEKRSRMVPGGWSNLRAVHGLLNKWLREIGGTFEPEKVKQMKRVGKNVQMELRYNRSAVREENLILVDADELAVLITAATEHCKIQMCEPNECRKCQLGKVMDNLSWISRDGRAWWEVFAAMVREEEAKNAG